MYNSSELAERIKKLAKDKNIPMSKLLNEVGLGFNTMSNMKTSMPKADNLAKIADYLDCSVDYLLGRTDIPDWQDVLKEMKVLNLDELRQFVNYARFLSEQNKKTDQS